MKRIQINKRLFAVQIKYNEDDFIWGICLIDRHKAIGEDYVLIYADKSFEKALIESLRRIENYMNKLESSLRKIGNLITGEDILCDDFELEHGFEDCEHAIFDEKENNYYLVQY